MAQNSGDRSTPALTYQTSSALNGYPTNTESVQSSSRTLYDVCLDIRKKVDGFLNKGSEESLLRNVQARVREAMSVIDQAFQRYEYVSSLSQHHSVIYVVTMTC
jgi:hypothetical protein